MQADLPCDTSGGTLTVVDDGSTYHVLVDGDEVATVDDPYDAALYAAAQERFRRDVRRHRLSADKCSRLCPDAPPGAFSASFDV